MSLDRSGPRKASAVLAPSSPRACGGGLSASLGGACTRLSEKPEVGTKGSTAVVERRDARSLHDPLAELDAHNYAFGIKSRIDKNAGEKCGVDGGGAPL